MANGRCERRASHPLSIWYLMLLLCNLGLGQGEAAPPQGFLSPSHKEQATNKNASHPSCSLVVSQRVRQHLLHEIVMPAAEAGVAAWPSGCPFDPAADLYSSIPGSDAQGALGRAYGRACLADYCELFDVCGGDAELSENQCDSRAMAQARRRCDQALASCFPLEVGNRVARTLHSRYSRQVCQMLDCQARAHHRHHEHTKSLLSVPPLLACLGILGLLGFGLLFFLLDGGEDFLRLLTELGFLAPATDAGIRGLREVLRVTAGFDRSKAS
eukprot:TRINITY_DN12611_c0_g1_i1.p1 TRINITY_DN12611_c0_g1~~TRINITY_DN12611_c0_g1_i1.p1  ORF type:complete len:271 (+),score=31.16 TRINITY_DN12611_c0_g1_i1:99-911(+)